MTTIACEERTDFQALLAAEGRSPEIPESADAYGWLVGSWELDVLHYWGVNVAARGIKGEAPRRLGARRPCRAGCLDHAAAFGAHRGTSTRR